QQRRTQRHRIAQYRTAAHLKQFAPREMPGQQANRSDARVERCLSVVGRISDHHREFSSGPDAAQRNLDDVSSRLPALYVVAAADRIDQILDPGHRQIVSQLLLLTVGGKSDLAPALLQILQKLLHAGQRSHVGEILFAKSLSLVLEKLLALT